MSDIGEAKRKLPLPSLMQRLGLTEHGKKSARCPFHEDRHNSFSVWQKDGVWFWKCHAGCGEGDEINFLEKHRTVSRGDAIKLYLEMAGVNGATPNKARLSVAFDWRSCVKAFTDKHIERLAEWRLLARILFVAQTEGTCRAI
jgi:DNA primase